MGTPDIIQTVFEASSPNPEQELFCCYCLKPGRFPESDPVHQVVIPAATKIEPCDHMETGHRGGSETPKSCHQLKQIPL